MADNALSFVGSQPTTLYVSARLRRRLIVHQRMRPYYARLSWRHIAWREARRARRRDGWVGWWRVLATHVLRQWRAHRFPWIDVRRGEGYGDDAPEGAYVVRTSARSFWCRIVYWSRWRAMRPDWYRNDTTWSVHWWRVSASGTLPRRR